MKDTEIVQICNYNAYFVVNKTTEYCVKDIVGIVVPIELMRMSKCTIKKILRGCAKKSKDKLQLNASIREPFLNRIELISDVKFDSNLTFAEWKRQYL